MGTVGKPYSFKNLKQDQYLGGAQARTFYDHQHRCSYGSNRKLNKMASLGKETQGMLEKLQAMIDDTLALTGGGEERR